MNIISTVELRTWLKNHADEMSDSLLKWIKINSHTFNLKGLESMADILEQEFSFPEASIKRHILPPIEKLNSDGVKESRQLGPCLQIDKHANSGSKVLLMIHMDTVYPENAPQQEIIVNKERIEGPGSADAKGGIAVILWALKALEEFCPGSLDWTVFLNSDEEIGSPGSLGLMKELAADYDVGLVYEPSLPNGDIISKRKGSGNFHIVCRGRSAHAGRDHHLGRNAIASLSRCLIEIDKLSGKWPEATFNIGTVRGGTALNVVPDLAIGGFNVRFSRPEDQKDIYNTISSIVDTASKEDGYSLELDGNFFSPPKPLDEAHDRMLHDIIDCGREVELNINHQSSGGVCDGNKLSGFGLTNIDTLGVQGGNIHSPNEYCLRNGLWERAALSANFLMKIASGEIKPKERYG